MAGAFVRLADRRRATFYSLSRDEAGEPVAMPDADVPRIYCTSCGEAWEDGHVDRCPPRTQPSRD